MQERRNSIRELFGDGGRLLSYSDAAYPYFNHQGWHLDDVKRSENLRSIVIWEIRETNFRCELRALDMFLRRTHDKSDYVQREHLTQVSKVWGSLNGGDGIIPHWENKVSPSSAYFYWTPAGYAGWKLRREHFSAFLSLLSGWPDCPQVIIQNIKAVETC